MSDNSLSKCFVDVDVTSNSEIDTAMLSLSKQEDAWQERASTPTTSAGQSVKFKDALDSMEISHASTNEVDSKVTNNTNHDNVHPTAPTLQVFEQVRSKQNDMSSVREPQTTERLSTMNHRALVKDDDEFVEDSITQMDDAEHSNSRLSALKPREIQRQDAFNTFSELALHQPQEKGTQYDYYGESESPLREELPEDDDDDWEKIEQEELDEDTLLPTAMPSVIYQNPSFKATIQEYVERYRLTDEQKETFKSLWSVMKWAGEIGYAVVSEPVMDAADWIVENQFGCHVEELPEELRTRLMTALPENVRHAIRATNSVAGRSVEVAAMSYRRLSRVTGLTRRTPRLTTEVGQGPVLEDVGDEVIDELEGMVMGTA